MYTIIELRAHRLTWNQGNTERSMSMTDEQKKKETFVRELAEVIYDYFPEIWKIRYQVNDGEEFIFVTYTNQSTRGICVTADSLSALVYDFGKYLIKH